MPGQACKLFAAVALLLAAASTGRADIAPHSPGPYPRPLVLPPEPVQPQPPGTCDAVRIYSVDDAHLVHRGEAATLTAVGTVSTAGWHDAQLRFTSVIHPHEADATATYEFVACPPEVGAEVMSPVAAAIDLVMPSASLHYIVINAQTNEKTLDLDARPPQP